MRCIFLVVLFLFPVALARDRENIKIDIDKKVVEEVLSPTMSYSYLVFYRLCSEFHSQLSKHIKYSHYAPHYVYICKGNILFVDDRYKFRCFSDICYYEGGSFTSEIEKEGPIAPICLLYKNNFVIHTSELMITRISGLDTSRLLKDNNPTHIILVDEYIYLVYDKTKKDGVYVNLHTKEAGTIISIKNTTLVDLHISNTGDVVRLQSNSLTDSIMYKIITI